MSAQFQVDTDRIAAAAGDVARISADIEGQGLGAAGSQYAEAQANATRMFS